MSESDEIRPPMKFNASQGLRRRTDKPLECMTTEELVRIVVVLHGLLDDIDTLGDAYKPDNLRSYKLAFDAAVSKANYRHELIWSDGYRLLGREKSK